MQATAGLRDAIVAVAVAEWEWFGKQEVDVTGQKSAPGKQEDSDDGSERVALYWREGVGEPGITGKDRNKYWSAAFISYVMLKAGAGALFRRSDHHQEYIYAAMVAAREKRNDYGYWGARLEDRAPELGDLICAWREEKITFQDAQKPGSYASHCDLVVAKTDTTVTVIGGNVGQSVTRRTFRLKNGKVTPDTYPQTFAILVNRMPAAAEAAVSAKLLDQVGAGPPSQTLPKVEFAPLGENAPIRGSFSITPPQIEKLCTGAKARYAFYAAAIAESSFKYGINPLFVLANFVNQGVKEAYRNPWGISTDFYPFGPNGSQLGQPNGNVKNGPRKFGENEWRIAFDRQFAVVATGKVYKNANTIAQWARIDAPPGAENDVGGTNAQEGRIVGALYDGLVQVLKASA
jgi:phage gp46-like protein